MDAQFVKLKQEVETDLGRSLEQHEEIELKALYYFGMAVKLKNQLESEPQHISEILPAVMADIERRMKTNRRKQRQRRILAGPVNYKKILLSNFTYSL